MTARWREWRGFVLFIAAMLLFRAAVADWNQVPSGSMLPSILVGDRILVDKLAYDLRLPFTLFRIARWADPARGDVVTFRSPEDERLLVKRVVGVPGDTVSLAANRLTVNGVEADYLPVEPAGTALPASALPATGYSFYRERILGRSHGVMLRDEPVIASVGEPPRDFAPVQVPDGQYLVLGDNRDNSRDSRAIGFIARGRIVGKATRVVFSLDYDQYYAPRMDRFLARLP